MRWNKLGKKFYVTRIAGRPGGPIALLVSAINTKHKRQILSELFLQLNCKSAELILQKYIFGKKHQGRPHCPACHGCFIAEARCGKNKYSSASDQ